MKRVASILILTLLFFSLSPQAVAGSYTNVTVSEAKAMIDSKPSLVVLDVRAQSEYDSGHIGNAKLIPVTELGGRLDELNKTDEILVYCKSGGRSSTASQLLADNGFLYVYNMLGGITAWKNEGYHVYVKYSSIQEAINNANEGDAIFVSSGIYYEYVVVNKTVSLIGENRVFAIIDGGGVGTVVNITANSAVIDGFTIKNSGQKAGEVPDVEMDSGICVYMADNVKISDNLVRGNADGIRLYESSNTNISGNVAENNSRFGILLYNCSNNYLRNNAMVGNKYNLGQGGYIQHVIHDVDVSNTVDGKPVYYWINQHEKVIPADAGYVVLVNCSGITVMNLSLSRNRHGVDLTFCRNSIVKNVNTTNNARDGILLYEGSSNITVTGCTSLNNMFGVRLVGARNNTIFGNMAMNNTVNGIYLGNSANNTIDGNWALNNDWHGISLGGSNNTTITENLAANNTIVGIGLWDSHNNTVKGNVVENNMDDGIYLFNSTDNAVVSNWALKNMNNGIELYESKNNFVESNIAENTTYSGIVLRASNDTLVVSNWAMNNSESGIWMYNSSSNTVVANWIEDNNLHGVVLIVASNNTIGSNTVSSNRWAGIGLWDSSNNTIRSNAAVNNGEEGFYLRNSTGNIITGNTAMRNSYGIYAYQSNSNLIYKNQFIENTEKQAYSDDSADIWDNGYEHGGNYWSDYTGKDEKSGPNQDLPGSDGIGDMRYVIDQNNQDHYPLMTTLVYDLSLINVTSPIHVYAGWTVYINVTIKNNGHATEDFIVIVYYDNNTIGTKTIIGLAPGQNITITISWDTIDLQLYTEYEIWAEAISVPGETSIKDNILVNGVVMISVAGDVDADRDIDLYDVVKICSVYGSKKGEPKYDVNCDVNGDDKIDLYDVVIACARYGERV